MSAGWNSNASAIDAMGNLFAVDVYVKAVVVR